jgi:L-alanine-DL-glutamate epimerase-like enolase superfamily enzyme
MKITDIRFARSVVPLVTPFTTALRSVDCIDDLIVIIKTDQGVLGYGSAASTPVITGELTLLSWELFDKFICLCLKAGM